MLDAVKEFLNTASGIIWGPLTLLLGAGTYLTLGLRAMPWRRTPAAFALLWQGRRAGGEGDITPFQALMTALSAAIGTGNIAGAATAIALGGPGAVFWMWITALLGMATKYSEAVLAVRFREVDERGKHVGGPMYYIRNGLGQKWRWLGIAFALFGTLAAFGIGNMVQANSVADAFQSTFSIPTWLTGLVMAVAAGAVILGGAAFWRGARHLFQRGGARQRPHRPCRRPHRRPCPPGHDWHVGHLHRYHHRLHHDRAGDRAQRCLDHRGDWRPALGPGLCFRPARRGRVHHHLWVDHLRLHHHSGLELLR